ncbi:HNH endonuclease signature motif containing protein [Mycolicibacterium komossense]|uniref:DUF222 domain-containing protein n=1 Tax=Mycolicibacterium komossense TaxID=1779 RepID=A0ABT3CII0_9MYCO|nr:HNH endonuclease [Mycolicibacterium komossense]MCV7229256.1 DUF222 domain-containing protein [Mycolicibacterium komossense]
MFDDSFPEPAELFAVSDAALVEAIAGWARASAAADARRLAAIDELVRRRCGDPDDERNLWACDPTDSAAAEVAVALNIGHGRAITQLKLAGLLRGRLPAINALFLAGSIPLTMVSTLMWRTLLVDEDVLDLLDAALAEDVIGWGPLSGKKLEQAIDLLIERHDPHAVRRLQQAARRRDVVIGDRDDDTGTAAIYGRLLATDATALKKRLNLMAHSVCGDDPRTMGQRRADALGALAFGSDHLDCLCGVVECPANPDDGRASNVHIHIVADPSALTAAPEPRIHGEYPGHTPAPEFGPDPVPTPEPAPAFTAEARRPAAKPIPVSAPLPLPKHAVASDLDLPAARARATPAPKPARPCRPGAGVILGGPIVPAALLAELIRNGAQVTVVREPGVDPEPRYTPSARLAEFVRMRDMTCRFPGCDLPADRADIDHTVPWPYGATHPGDVKCYCRKHHNLKTWWTGDWADHQSPDGTVTVTSPTGTTYTTKPVSSLLFPGWNTATTASPPRGAPPTRPPGCGAPRTKRKRTRAQGHAYRIGAERALNAALIAAAAPGDPPPFSPIAI